LVEAVTAAMEGREISDKTVYPHHDCSAARMPREVYPMESTSTKLAIMNGLNPFPSAKQEFQWPA
jgi:hypothetical protein